MNSSLTRYLGNLRTSGKYIAPAITTKIIPHSMASPLPNDEKNSDHGFPGFCPDGNPLSRTHDPKFAPTIANGTPIKINQ
ncbi:MAG: hypothetical protein MJ200_02210 [Mycoplasmoidaceae bacterium]|nr:hypothetical protein [Mycoplasmoidaceae bacterium]